MKFYILLFSLFLLVEPVFCNAAGCDDNLSTTQAQFNESQYLRISSGRNVFYRELKAKKNKPTLIFLPGINRAVPECYSMLKILEEQGYGLVLMATSSHWQSLSGRQLDSEKAYFDQNNSVSTLDFTNEIDALVSFLNIKNPILVSLSYISGMADSSQFAKIHTAPLVTASESNPEAAASAAQWEAGLGLNPFFGKIWIRQFRDSNYSSYWSNIVNQTLLIDPNAFGTSTKDEVIRGYMSLSRAIEDFDLRKSQFQNIGGNKFILGEFESQVRLKGQFEAILNSATVAPTQVLIVRNALHNVQDSQPQGFTTALIHLLTDKSVANLKIGFVESDSNLSPNSTLQDAVNLRNRTGHSTIPVTEDGGAHSKLVGLLTNKDFWEFKDDLSRKVSAHFTPVDKLVMAEDGVTLQEATEKLWKSKKECLPIVKKDGTLKALVFRKDYFDHKSNPLELVDSGKRLFVGAALNTFDFKEPIFGTLVQYPATDGKIYNYKQFIEKTHAAGGLSVFGGDAWTAQARLLIRAARHHQPTTSDVQIQRFV